MFGKELDDVFNQCQFAIGSLGRHRSGITVIKTLKNREYATRGIPFIYSEIDSDFEHQPYILKAPADESPVDIQKIVDFVHTHQWNPEDIRKTIRASAMEDSDAESGGGCVYSSINFFHCGMMALISNRLAISNASFDFFDQSRCVASSSRSANSSIFPFSK